MSTEFQLSQSAPKLEAATRCKIAECRFCDQIQTSSGGNIRIHCTKLSGSPHPILVNLNTCLSCNEFHRL